MARAALNKVDAIIAGGGLAGIHLALAMDSSGFTPLVLDQPDPHSSSRLAAGIINPITGRRFALSWLYQHLEPVFTEVYRHWETMWNVRFLHQKNIYRSVPHNKLVNDLDVKLSDPEYERYCRKMSVEEVDRVGQMIRFQPPGYVMHGFQVDTTIFLEAAIQYLASRGMYRVGRFEESSAQVRQKEFRFQEYQSEKLIWASGASIVNQPAFSWVQMNPNKGEILHLRSEGPVLNEIIKQTSFYVPIGGDKIWLGTYDSWEVEEVKPSAEGLRYLESKAESLKYPYTVLDHCVAVRPAVEDRRPVIGYHPDHDRLYLFNGFGSKGTSLIPYFAQMMVEYMVKDRPIHPEADVQRYWK